MAPEKCITNVVHLRYFAGHWYAHGVGCSFQQEPPDILQPNDNTRVSLPWNSMLGQGKDLVLLVRSLSLFYPVGTEAEINASDRLL